MKVGVLGGGQLGRMLGLAGIPLGHEFVFFDPSPEAPARVVGAHVCADYSDEESLSKFGRDIDVCTYEFENVPLHAAEIVSRHAAVKPGLEALRQGQDRGLEKELFRKHDIPVPEFALVESYDALEAAVEKIGVPGVLKTTRMGYDGKGQVVVRRLSELAEDYESIGKRPAIYEKFVAFDEEVSILGVRSEEGDCRFYSLVHNEHKDGILRKSAAPASCAEQLQSKAEAYAQRLMDSLRYVGVLAIEFFRVGEELLANEMAPRVHNSGHWTIEGAVCSQFENHVRAITGMPLGDTVNRGAATMVNIIGDLPNLDEILSHANAHLHLYGKSPRPGRKIGHYTILEEA